MRSFVILAALSCASLAAAQDSPEAPPLHPNQPGDGSDEASTTTTTTKEIAKETTTTHVKTTEEAEPTSVAVSEEPIITSVELTAVSSVIYIEPTTLEPEVPTTTSWENSAPYSTQSVSSGFFTIQTDTSVASTPDVGSPTTSAPPPVVTAGADVLRWGSWSAALVAVAALFVSS